MPRTQTCVLCTETITDDPYGHNPAPLADHGVCCSDCNTTKVIPARFAELTEDSDSSSTDSEEDDDGWEEVYSVITGESFLQLLGDHEHLQRFKPQTFKDYSTHTVYYQTYGGGPAGGYFVKYYESETGRINHTDIYSVERTWDTPFKTKFLGNNNLFLFELGTEDTVRRCKVIFNVHDYDVC